MERRINKLTKNINEAKSVKNIFNTIAGSSIVLCSLCLLLFASLSNKVHVIAFILVFVLSLFLLGIFIFSNIVINQCEDKIDKWTTERTMLINQMESTKTKFDIANAFAHCYWNALNGEEFITERTRMEIEFKSTDYKEI